MEASKKKQNYLGENPNSQQILLTDQVYPRIQVTYGGADEFRGTEEFDVEQFIAVKGYKAKGKRLTTYQIESIVELEPIRFPEPEPEPEQETEPEPETPENSENSEYSENSENSENSEPSEAPQPLNEQPSLFSDEDF
jgi:topoisomerase-4 subunit A